MDKPSLMKTEPVTDILDLLSKEQLEELDKAIQEVDNNETTSWEDFKKEMKKWKGIFD